MKLLNDRPVLYDVLILLFICLECLLLLYNEQIGLSQVVNASCVLVSSLLTGVLVLLKFYKRRADYGAACTTPVRPGSLGIVALFIVGFCLLAPGIAAAFREMPAEVRFSDIVPTLQVLVRRLLGGEAVYQPITEFGYYLPVTYMPMQWMPYTVAEWLAVDYRWVAVGIWALAAGWLVLRSAYLSRLWQILAAVLMLLAALWMIRRFDTGILTMTIELMVAGYYMCLVMSLNRQNPWIKGLFIAICLMSRYSLVLWLPLWFVVELISGPRMHVWRSVAVITGFVLLIYILPFLLPDPGSLGRGLKAYSGATAYAWQQDGPGGRPIHLYSGAGFASVYLEQLSQYSLPDRIRALQKTQLAVSLGAVVLMGLWYIRVRNRIDRRIFLMASFKIYMSLFLALMQIPYTYLMITGIFISVALFAEQARYRPGLRL
jgi:hypothetical protein